MEFSEAGPESCQFIALKGFYGRQNKRRASRTQIYYITKHAKQSLNPFSRAISMKGQSLEVSYRWLIQSFPIKQIQYLHFDMSEIRQEDESEGLLNTSSEKRRFPEVFKWKVAAIVISVLIAIFLVVDIILLVHYNNSQPRKNNYTFIADVLSNSASATMPRQSFVNLITALSVSYEDLWFQSANLVQTWSAPPLTLDKVGSFFDGDASDNQLFLFSLKDAANNNYLAAAYSHIGFPLPSNWQDYLINPKNQYYIFEIDNRESTLLGGSSQKFLRMSGNSDNLLNCNAIKLKETSITYLEMFSLDFSDPATVTVTLGAPTLNTKCFEGQPDSATALSDLQSYLGITDLATVSLTLSQVQVFHLSE